MLFTSLWRKTKIASTRNIPSVFTSSFCYFYGSPGVDIPLTAPLLADKTRPDLISPSFNLLISQLQPPRVFDLTCYVSTLTTTRSLHWQSHSIRDTMDEATKLVSELQQKLTELDHKVWQYQRDMTSEFEKYAEDLLREVPQDISETVSKTIAESMKGCRFLYPDGARSIES